MVMSSRGGIVASWLLLVVVTSTGAICPASNWFVIATSSNKKSEAVRVVVRLRALGCRNAFVTDSSEWRNLRPGFWIAVGGEFARKADANRLKLSLINAGIRAYIKQPGSRADGKGTSPGPLGESRGTSRDGPSLFRGAQAAVVTVTAGDSVGSGFAVAPTLICTCYHVIKGSTSPSVSLLGYRVTGIVATDPGKDVAILRLDHAVPKWLALNRGGVPPTGTEIYTIGTPLGLLEKTMANGIISGLRKMPTVAYVQITAPISPGCSGSPILTVDGLVIAMARSTIEEGQSLNLAVSAWDILSVVARAKR